MSQHLGHVVVIISLKYFKSLCAGKVELGTDRKIHFTTKNINISLAAAAAPDLAQINANLNRFSFFRSQFGAGRLIIHSEEIHLHPELVPGKHHYMMATL